MASFLSALVVAAVVCLAKAQDDENSDYCKSSVEQDLKIDDLKGVWWEKASFNTDSYVEVGDSCHVSSFYPTTDLKQIHVTEDYVSRTNEHKKSSYLIEDKDLKNNDGHLVAQMTILKPGLGKKEVKWDILETDYTNFMVVMMCHDAPGTKNDFKTGLLLVRKQNGVDLESADIQPQIAAALKNNKLDHSFFQNNDIDKCADVVFPEAFTVTAE